MREEGEAASRCINTNCPARLKESVLHFAARGVMDIDGMGEVLVDQLVSRGHGQKRGRHLRFDPGAIARARSHGKEIGRKGSCATSTPRAASLLPRVLNGLGIPFVGERTAQILADTFGGLDAIAEADRRKAAGSRGGGPESLREHSPVFSRAAQSRTGGASAPGRVDVRPRRSKRKPAARWRARSLCLPARSRISRARMPKRASKRRAAR